MKNTLRNATIAAAFATSLGTAATAVTTDLAFIMDRSGSIIPASLFDSAMESLADALAANIPVADANNQYRISVITFASASSAGADVIVGDVLVNDQDALDGVVASIRADNRGTGGQTCYSCAFDRLQNVVGNPTGDQSIINMMTDGSPNRGLLGADLDARILDLRTAGWDSLSFEAVSSSAGARTLMSNLAFDTDGTGTQPIFDDPDDIKDPLNESFVLQVSNFGDAYATAISTKVQRVIEPNVVPVPAALPLLLAGLGMFGALRLRKSKTSAA